ncbi:MAG TPA: CpsB/CapC family capsule biosynthesis tyrosine phosphatase [Thermoanaerobaculia bacterium]|nr:CpsB/CapC family capsule biosynthesis tyrosine phosphatase [Thermoanaerobaculia bacterium]
MIDIHHHCLPGIDDGPRELAEAVALCRRAADEGVETIVATPHVLRGRWQNTSRAKLESLIEALREQVGAYPRLVLGSEYFFAHDMTEVLASGNAIIPINDSRYVLVEFAAHSVPPLIEQAFYRVQLEGWTPIVAHPERNLVFQSKPELLSTLVRLGARTQVTCGSLLGDFGPEARAAGTQWVREGLVHFLASDAHNLGKRPPRVRESLVVLRDLVDESIVEALTRGNPQAVIEGRPLVYEPDIADTPPQSRARRIFSAVQRVLGKP